MPRGGLFIYISVSTQIETISDAVSGWAPRSSHQQSSATRWKVEIPTVALSVVIFAGYALLTCRFRQMPLWLAAPLMALWLTWYGSLQHETIHDHPTPWRRLNSLLGSLPLALWIPYRVYRVTHLQHHRHGGRGLTDASRDPESFYLHPGTLARQGRLRRALCLANCTLAGRLTIGPALAVYAFWLSEVRKLRAGDGARKAIWARHILAVALVLIWVTQICHIPLWTYLLCVIYPSISLTQLRSFAEHRADDDPTRRTVAVEAHLFWSLLFLNNNLHIAHHAYPRLSWYKLPSAWRQLRNHALDRGLIAGGYLEVAQSYLLHPVISPEHPGLERP